MIMLRHILYMLTMPLLLYLAAVFYNFFTKNPDYTGVDYYEAQKVLDNNKKNQCLNQQGDCHDNIN